MKSVMSKKETETCGALRRLLLEAGPPWDRGPAVVSAPFRTTSEKLKKERIRNISCIKTKSLMRVPGTTTHHRQHVFIVFTNL